MNSHSKTNNGYTRLWRPSGPYNLELLKAGYTAHVFSRHSHEAFVISVIETGVEGFYCQGKTFRAPAGSIIIINPEEVHTGYSADKVPSSFRSIYPKPDFLQNVAKQLYGRKSDLPLFSAHVIKDKPLAGRLLRLHNLLEKEEDILKSHSLLLSALADLVARYSDNKREKLPAGRENSTIKLVKEYIIENHFRTITLNELAKISGLSPFYLLRSYRKAVGLPPYEFLINVRVRRAKRLLKQGLPIARVAYDIGFADQSHLTRHFKRIVGVTPGQYLK